MAPRLNDLRVPTGNRRQTLSGDFSATCAARGSLVELKQASSLAYSTINAAGSASGISLWFGEVIAPAARRSQSTARDRCDRQCCAMLFSSRR
jgi:hypothetical protein